VHGPDAIDLCPARHLSVTSETAELWRDLSYRTAWRDAPPIRISPQLRKTGTYQRRGKPNQVRDRSADRDLLRRQAEREAAETAADGGPGLAGADWPKFILSGIGKD